MCNCNKSIPEIIKSGVIGISKNIIGKDIDTEENIKKKRDICRECSEATKTHAFLNHSCKGLTSLSFCKLCKCNILLKTRLSTEHCIINKW